MLLVHVIITISTLIPGLYNDVSIRFGGGIANGGDGGGSKTF